jgi:hypothetical protein
MLENMQQFLLVIWQGELAKGARSESNSCEQLLNPNYIDNYVHFGIVMQFVKYSTFYLIKFNYIHCFVVYINTFGQCISTPFDPVNKHL